MTCLVAIETDPKSIKVIEECWRDITKDANHKIIIYNTLAAFTADFAKPEHSADSILILMVPLETLGTEPEKTVEKLATSYKCNILICLFDDPLKTVKRLETSIAKNLLYKPFDLTILKEHTRFLLFPNQKVKAQYVHTTVAKNKLESLKKFKFLQLSESQFKIDKAHPLVMGNAYKFYHSFFQHLKTQHVWGRVVNESADGYELSYAQMTPPVLMQIRKRVAASKQRFKNPGWYGMSTNTMTGADIVIHIDDEPTALIVQQLIERTFKSNIIMHKKDFKTSGKIQADLLITDAPYESQGIKTEFIRPPIIFRLYEEVLEREKVQERLAIEHFRFEKPLDKAYLIKAMKVAFPIMQEKEISQVATVPGEGLICLSDQMVVEEFSEAAMGFNHSQQFKENDMIDIALSQDDETTLKEMKVKIHYVDEKPNAEKAYYHQAVLYGMKDEFLKEMRLWTLQMHIQKNQKK